jgi:hypothetical protein
MISTGGITMGWLGSLGGDNAANGGVNHTNQQSTATHAASLPPPSIAVAIATTAGDMTVLIGGARHAPPPPEFLLCTLQLCRNGLHLAVRLLAWLGVYAELRAQEGNSRGHSEQVFILAIWLLSHLLVFAHALPFPNARFIPHSRLMPQSPGGSKLHNVKQSQSTLSREVRFTPSVCRAGTCGMSHCIALFL